MYKYFLEALLTLRFLWIPMWLMFPLHCAVTSYSIWHIPLWAPLCNIPYIGPVTASWKHDWKIAVAAFFGTRILIDPLLVLRLSCWIQQGCFRAIMSRFPCEQTHTHAITHITHAIEQTFSWPCDLAHCQLLKYCDTKELVGWNEYVFKIQREMGCSSLRMICPCLLLLFLQLW